MQIRKYRWSKVYESSEEELVALFQQKSIEATHWFGEDGEVFTDKRYPQDTRLWCAEGMVSCVVAGKNYSLQPGDVLDIPAQVSCTLRVGFGGCGMYESGA